MKPFKIDFIYVSQSYRGQGVASSLLKSAPRISFVTNMMKYERLFQKNDFVNDFRNNYIKF
jgi:GNAT superfamily N-acetyltransferase